ncbi:hypothetical protein L1887_50877 [Cichorium endivia]|nr:hypothetical protein L1887_50877 [Cichorium endivia]
MKLDGPASDAVERLSMADVALSIRSSELTDVGHSRKGGPDPTADLASLIHRTEAASAPASSACNRFDSDEQLPWQLAAHFSRTCKVLVACCSSHHLTVQRGDVGRKKHGISLLRDAYLGVGTIWQLPHSDQCVQPRDKERAGKIQPVLLCFLRRTIADLLSKSNKVRKIDSSTPTSGSLAQWARHDAPSQRAYGRIGRGSAARIYVGWTARAAWAVSGCAIAALSLPHGDMTIRPFARP